MNDPIQVFEQIVESFKKALLGMSTDPQDQVIYVRLQSKDGQINVGAWAQRR